MQLKNSVILAIFATLALSALAEDCGPKGDNKKCPVGTCCSKYGYCGITDEHCLAECNEAFGECGKRTGGNNGEDVSGRPAKIIENCKRPGDFAFTFDDGPNQYTSQLIDYLNKNKVKATFFINGNNFEDIREPKWAKIVEKAYKSGHQIASHTMTHPYLSKLSVAEIVDEMVSLEKVLMKIIGKAPGHMRLPFGDHNETVLKVLNKLKYKVVGWNLDTKDTEHNGKKSFPAYQDFVGKASSKKDSIISLQHDFVKNSSLQLPLKVIPYMKKRGYRFVTVAECIGDKAGAYKNVAKVQIDEE